MVYSSRIPERSLLPPEDLFYETKEETVIRCDVCDRCIEHGEEYYLIDYLLDDEVRCQDCLDDLIIVKHA